MSEIENIPNRAAEVKYFQDGRVIRPIPSMMVIAPLYAINNHIIKTTYDISSILSLDVKLPVIEQIKYFGKQYENYVMSEHKKCNIIILEKLVVVSLREIQVNEPLYLFGDFLLPINSLLDGTEISNELRVSLVFFRGAYRTIRSERPMPVSRLVDIYDGEFDLHISTIRQLQELKFGRTPDADILYRKTVEKYNNGMYVDCPWEQIVASLKNEMYCVCGKPGIKKCSRCKTKYYCCRECQNSDWKRHKNECKSIV
jgi:hypothetical protein